MILLRCAYWQFFRLLSFIVILLRLLYLCFALFNLFSNLVLLSFLILFVYPLFQLFTTYLTWDDAKKQAFRASLTPSALTEFESCGRVAADIHRRNAHKLEYPINLNVFNWPQDPHLTVLFEGKEWDIGPLLFVWHVVLSFLIYLCNCSCLFALS